MAQSASLPMPTIPPKPSANSGTTNTFLYLEERAKPKSTIWTPCLNPAATTKPLTGNKVEGTPFYQLTIPVSQRVKTDSRELPSGPINWSSEPLSTKVRIWEGPVILPCMHANCLVCRSFRYRSRQKDTRPLGQRQGGFITANR